MEKIYDNLLTVIENGLSEHIDLISKLNEKLKEDEQLDFQSVADINESILALRRLLTPCQAEKGEK